MKGTLEKLAGLCVAVVCFVPAAYALSQLTQGVA